PGLPHVGGEVLRALLPARLAQGGEHDDDGDVADGALEDHEPEVGDGGGQRALGGDEAVRGAGRRVAQAHGRRVDV
ncbi:hypothetical protein KEM52_005112, partial [Ascosphaera acerosa]